MSEEQAERDHEDLQRVIRAQQPSAELLRLRQKVEQLERELAEARTAAFHFHPDETVRMLQKQLADAKRDASLQQEVERLRVTLDSIGHMCGSNGVTFGMIEIAVSEALAHTKKT